MGSSSTTVQGPSGPPANYPAAQPQPPSLGGAYPVGNNVDFITVIKTLTTYRDWAGVHPDPNLVKNYMWTVGNDYASEVQGGTFLQQHGIHTSAVPSIIQWAKVTMAPVIAPGHQINGHQLFEGGSVTIVQDLTPEPYLNAAGQVVAHEPGGGPTAYSMTLAQGAPGAQAPDGQFRIVDVRQLNPPGGIPEIESQ
jgi:hypothetical protein